MNPSEGLRLAEARRQLPQMALRLGSREAVQEGFLRLHPDLSEALGESLCALDLESLASSRSPAWLRSAASSRCSASSGTRSARGTSEPKITAGPATAEYPDAPAERGEAAVLAAEFESRFGHGMDGARAA